MKDCFYVYVYCDPNKAGEFKYGNYKFAYEPFYVGKGCGNRLYEHIRTIRNGKISGNLEKDKRVKFILQSGKNPIIAKMAENLSEVAALELEEFVINQIGRKIAQEGPLLNIQIGGNNPIAGKNNPMYGRKGKDSPLYWTKKRPDYWEKVSKSLMGSKNPMYGKFWTDDMKKVHSEKVKRFYRNASLDRIQEIREIQKRGHNTKEYKEKMSKKFTGPGNPMYGKKRTAESRKNISLSLKGKFSGSKNPKAKKWKVISPLGEIFIIEGELQKFCAEKNIGCYNTLVNAGKQNRVVTCGNGAGWCAVEIPKH